ncbi:tyrosine-type recombinase/integrase [Photobacterium kishitanii]|uniref:tyrosine-type recombinase/integrase n=1 Tax=Photobacterium kishitanii TaxID=318456 RepID=UPI0007F8B837|nr:tyrosine-type recombinase/integrase [Photobacterium kishitanii]OBU31449.1 hypothetical protein AYY23_19505 [Photobacterium kishitanii]PSW45336.1 integrase [Photobacterium kishitanii]
MDEFVSKNTLVAGMEPSSEIAFRTKQVRDSVTNPAFSYINSLSATNSIGGRANAKYLIERFTLHFLGPSYEKISWERFINEPSFAIKAIAGYLRYQAQQKAYYSGEEISQEQPFFNLHIKPVLTALSIVGDQLLLQRQITIQQHEAWIDLIFNTDFSKTNHLPYGSLLPSESLITMDLSSVPSNVIKALESFSCFLITSCISRFNWDQFLMAPVVKAMMTNYFDLGIIKNGKKIRPYSPSTVENTYRMLCGVAEHHWLAENMTVERLQRIKAIKLAKGSRNSSGRFITFDDLDSMLSIIDSHPNPIRITRDKAMISLMFYSGLRRQEIVNLRVCDIDWSEFFISVIGKGNKERVVPFSPDSEAANYLREWINILTDSDSDSEAEFADQHVFTKVSKSKRVTKSSLTTQSVNDVCKWISVRLSKTISPHDFRHTAATNLLKQGHDLLTVSAVLGHASPNTTQRYDKRGSESLKTTTIQRV